MENFQEFLGKKTIFNERPVSAYQALRLTRLVKERIFFIFIFPFLNVHIFFPSTIFQNLQVKVLLEQYTLLENWAISKVKIRPGRLTVSAEVAPAKVVQVHEDNVGPLQILALETSAPRTADA